MSVRILATTTTNPAGGEAAVEAYLELVGPLMERAGAQVVDRYEVAYSISGATPSQFVSIIEYPDEDAVRSVFDDPSYLAGKAVRDAAFSQYDVCVLR